MNRDLVRRRWRGAGLKAALLMALMGVVLVQAGCFVIEGLTIPTDIESPPEMNIAADVTITVDPAVTRATLAFRYPSEWEIVSVNYTGAATGDFFESPTMEGYFETTWEATAPDDNHNGHKDGYAWWAGYSGAHDFAQDDDLTLKIRVRPHRSDGDFLLDFVTGYTSADSPADPTANGNGALWETGGARLDQPCTLLPAADPAVVSTVPADGATNVGLETDPQVRFSESVDAATLTGANVFVRPEGGAALPSAVFYNDITHTVTIDLNDPLAYDTPYEIVVKSAVKDLVGYRMVADYVGGFRTMAEAVAPVPVLRYPASSDTDVPVDASLYMTFDQDMDAATIVGANFYVTPQGSMTPVPAVVTYVAAERKAVIDPIADLAGGATYQVTLTAGVKGANGLSVQGAPISWTFTTKEAIAFTDVSATYPYHDAIMGLAEEGFISGYPMPGGTWQFRPGNDVWRAQFAKIIANVLGLDLDESMPLPPFTDLGPDVLVGSATVDNLYPHEYVAAAYENGITTGMTPTTFGPYLNISRAQAVTMTVRALQNLYPGLLEPPAGGYVNSWGTSFSSVHGPNARIAEYNGLLAGLPVGVGGAAHDPWEAMSRGEVSQLLWNAFMLIETAP